MEAEIEARGWSGRHERFDDSGHAKAERPNERVLVISPWGEKRSLDFSGKQEKGGTRREDDANKPGRK